MISEFSSQLPRPNASSSQPNTSTLQRPVNSRTPMAHSVKEKKAAFRGNLIKSKKNVNYLQQSNNMHPSIYQDLSNINNALHNLFIDIQGNVKGENNRSMDINSKTLDDYIHAPSVPNDNSLHIYMQAAVVKFTDELILGIQNKKMSVVSCLQQNWVGLEAVSQNCQNLFLIFWKRMHEKVSFINSMRLASDKCFRR